jgi:hypothetical protein
MPPAKKKPLLALASGGIAGAVERAGGASSK